MKDDNFKTTVYHQ